MNTIGFISKSKEEKKLWEEDFDPKAKIFGEDVFLPASFNTALNENVLVVGTSGTGKTQSFVEPNILQGYSNYVIADSKGQILKQLGSSLKSMGYNIEVLNLINLNSSMTYNPLANCKSELDVLSFARDVVTTSIEGVKTITSNQDPFWNNSATALLEALIFFVKEVYPPEEQTMEAVGELFEILDEDVSTLSKEYSFAPEVDYEEKDENGNQSVGEKLFQWLSEKNNNSQAVKMWRQVYSVSSSEKTWASIVGILGTALSPYMLSETRTLLQSNQISFTNLLKEKTALFVIYDDADDSKNFISNILYKQLIRFLYHTALNAEDGRLSKKVQFYLDDFKNITIPQFDDYLATARSRNISFSIMVQDESQLVSKFGQNANSVIGNCTTYLLTGTTDLRMAKIAEERFSYSAKEIRTMHAEDFLVDIGGQAVKTRRYDLENHPNYNGKTVAIEEVLLKNPRPTVVYTTLSRLLKEILGEESFETEVMDTPIAMDIDNGKAKDGAINDQLETLRERILQSINKMETNEEDETRNDTDEDKAAISYDDPMKKLSRKPITILRCKNCNKEVTNIYERCPYCNASLGK